MPCKAGLCLGIDLLIHEKYCGSDQVKFHSGVFTQHVIDTDAKREVIVVIIIEYILDGMVASSEAPDHVANFCRDLVFVNFIGTYTLTTACLGIGQ